MPSIDIESPSGTSIDVEKGSKERDVVPISEDDQEFPSGMKVALLMLSLSLAIFLVALVSTTPISLTKS
jgi:hypothetical protein